MISKMLNKIQSIENKSGLHVQMYKNLVYIQSKLNKNPEILNSKEYQNAVAKQSLESAAKNIQTLSTMIKETCKKVSKPIDKSLPERKIKRGYYTSDIYQEWIDEDSPSFNETDYMSYQKFLKTVRK